MEIETLRFIGGPKDGEKWRCVKNTYGRQIAFLHPPRSSFWFPDNAEMSLYVTDDYYYYIRRLPDVYVHESLEVQRVSNQIGLAQGPNLEEILPSAKERLARELLRTYPSVDPRTFYVSLDSCTYSNVDMTLLTLEGLIWTKKERTK